MTLTALGILLFFTSHRWLAIRSSAVLPSPSSAVRRSPDPAIRYESHSLPQSVVYTLLIPVQGRAQDRYIVTPALSPELDSLAGLTQKYPAPPGATLLSQPGKWHTIAALNGGFFDPVNHKSTSHVTLQGKQLADPRLNQRLIQNPHLAPYLDKILNRSEFRRYQCGQTVRYNIVLHREPPPPGCQLRDALGGGPRLLPQVSSAPEGFLAYANGEVIRDPLRSSQLDARTAVGITRDRSIIWVMVAQKPGAPDTSGMSLQGLAELMQTLGAEKAMNLDGGSSSAFFYQGETFYGKVKEAGQVRRPVKSALLLQELAKPANSSFK